MPTYGLSVIASSIPPWAVNERIGTAAGRYALNTMLMPRTDSGLTYTDYRSGVMASGDGGPHHLAMQVNPAGGMSVTVNQGNAVINTQNQGAYMCCLDEQRTVSLNPSSGSTNRIDLVIARVYDDNNSALSGENEIRQFAVEVVQGDASTSTATQPEPPIGAIPLAAVSVSKGLGSVSAKQITDLRGPGLVARGGMRALYGADAQPGAAEYERPGAYPGDQRWVHSNHFQHQVYYGQSEDPHKGGWRGVHNCLVYNANPTGGALIWARGNGARTEACRVHIPYPGSPFMIYPSGRAASILSSLTSAGFGIHLNDVWGPLVNWQYLDVGSTPDNNNKDTDQVFNVAPIMWGPHTEALDVLLVAEVNTTNRPGVGGVSFRASEATLLSVCVYPSTIEPPATSA